MTTFQIQNIDGTYSPVNHKQFYEALNSDRGYLYYKQGGKHLAMLPTAENAETIRICRQSDNAENYANAAASRCRDEKGHVCRFQHDGMGRVIRNEEGRPVSAKCGDCPRNGWTAGKRENCCIRNYCKIEDCTYCSNPREYHTPLSLEWLTEDKHNPDGIDGAGLSVIDPDADVHAAFEREELHAALHMAIGQLPLEEQHILNAVFWDRLSQRTYATENGMSKSTVNRLYSRALESLKNILKDFY